MNSTIDKIFVVDFSVFKEKLKLKKSYYFHSFFSYVMPPTSLDILHCTHSPLVVVFASTTFAYETIKSMPITMRSLKMLAFPLSASISVSRRCNDDVTVTLYRVLFYCVGSSINSIYPIYPIYKSSSGISVREMCIKNN